MKSEFVYYAKKIGSPSYMEEIACITSEQMEPDLLELLKENLEERGMEFVRVWEFKGEAPDFAGTVNV